MKKSERKRQIPYNFTYMYNLKTKEMNKQYKQTEKYKKHAVVFQWEVGCKIEWNR